MALGGLLIAAIVAVIFWLIGLSPPPPHEPESANAPESANEPRSQRSSVPSALSAGTRAPVASAVRA